MGGQGGEILVLAVLSGGPDDDAGSVAQGVRDIGKRWSAIGTLRPPPREAAPEGTRSGELAVLGAVCATVLPVVPDLVAALGSVSAWIGARRGRTAKVVRPDGSSIEVSGISAESQRALIQSWIDAAAPPR